mgnify:FL=1
MLLTPAAARPWLGPASRNRPWPGHGPMMVRRREALAVLYAAYGSWVRLALGTLAWGLGVAGGVLAGQGVAAGGEGPAASVAVGLLLLATFLGGAVVATGSALARAIAGWLTLATAVRADGGRVDGTPPDPDTLRTHEEVLAQDRAEGARELWRPPLLPRTLAALVLGAAGLVLAAQAALGFGEVSTPYAGQDARGAWLARVVVAAVCLLTALLTGSGLRRVHRARMHRVAHEQPAEPASPPPGLTPAVATGPIVVAGSLPPPGAHAQVPRWAGPAGAGETPAVPEPGGAPAVPESGGAPAVPESGGAPAAPESEGVLAVPESEGAPAVPTPAGPGAPVGAPAGPAPRVRLGDGRELGPGTTLLGRDPVPRPGEHVDAVVAVTDEHVSKTHLTVRVGPGHVVVTDRGSTNGTVAHHPDGTVHRPRPGEPHPLPTGAVVVLGATTLTVGDPDEDVEHTVLRTP